MTREDIIRMAREAGWIIRDDLHYMDHQAMQDALIERIERFAALVAAHIRETEFKPDWNNYRQGLADGAAEEREACADLVENFAIDMDDELVCGKAAKAIRARGQ